MATPIQEISDLWLDLKNQFYAGTRTHYWTPEQYNRFMDLISDGLYTKLTGDEAQHGTLQRSRHPHPDPLPQAGEGADPPLPR